MQDDIKKTGYSPEEEYFHKLNRERIEKHRDELNARRNEQAAHNGGAAHWMRCPKCGGEMEPVELAQILVDKCNACLGVYFDHGELELLLDAREPKGFLDGLKRLFA